MTDIASPPGHVGVAGPEMSFPFAKPPPIGELVEVRPGILWTQFPLPFALNHVNVYMLKDGDGWAVVDAGIGDARTRQVWGSLLGGPLRGETLTRIIVTHFHPDHIGCAGWLIDEFALPLYMSRSEYLYNQVMHRNAAGIISVYRVFYERRGLDAAKTEAILRAGHDYVGLTAPMPPAYHCLADGETLTIGNRNFEVITGGGHSWEQVMLYDRADSIVIVADQVLPKISPNISVVASEPDNDPLAVFLKSNQLLAARIASGSLALPGHRLPFFGLHHRIAELAAHHDDRCTALVAACTDRPMSPAELIPILFFAGMDTQQTSFAFCEIVAHLNYLKRRSMLAEVEEGGTIKFIARKGAT
jgi:glyoxylase-like metal-dependent hydrolase (beta-lactamase superfamily II)